MGEVAGRAFPLQHFSAIAWKPSKRSIGLLLLNTKRVSLWKYTRTHSHRSRNNKSAVMFWVNFCSGGSLIQCQKTVAVYECDMKKPLSAVKKKKQKKKQQPWDKQNVWLGFYGPKLQLKWLICSLFAQVLQLQTAWSMLETTIDPKCFYLYTLFSCMNKGHHTHIHIILCLNQGLLPLWNTYNKSMHSL